MKCQECNNQVPEAASAFGVTLCERCQAELLLIDKVAALEKENAELKAEVAGFCRALGEKDPVSAMVELDNLKSKIAEVE